MGSLRLGQQLQIFCNLEVNQIATIMERTHRIVIFEIQLPVTMEMLPECRAGTYDPICFTFLGFDVTAFQEPPSDGTVSSGDTFPESVEQPSLSCHDQVTSLLSI